MPDIFAVLGDITKIKCDAIVNAANTFLAGGGGVDGAIHIAAGPELAKECRNLGGCGIGEVKITGGYGLPAQYIIHTVGPLWRGGHANEHALLALCYEKSIKLAGEKGIKTIAFPAISTGAYGFPKRQAAEIAIKTVQKFLENTAVEKVIFVLYKSGDLKIYDELCSHNISDCKKTVKVAGAYIIDEGKMLVARRAMGELKGFWEFPGGKIEEDETAFGAVVREIREEMGVVVEPVVIKGIFRYEYDFALIEMALVECRWVNGQIQLDGSHSEYNWIFPEEASGMTPMDKIIIRDLTGTV